MWRSILRQSRDSRARVVATSLALATTALAAFGACGDGGTTTDVPIQTSLAVSPASLAFVDSSNVGKLFLTTAPSGGRLTWRVAQKPAWLQLSADSGIIDRGIVEVSVSVPTLAELDPQTLQGSVDIVSSGGTASVAVAATSRPTYLLQVGSSPLTIDESTDSATLVVRNVGKATVQLTARSGASWLTAQLGAGAVARRDSVLLRLRADKATLPVGASTTSIVITNQSRPDSIVVPATIRVRATPLLSLSTAQLAFTSSVLSRSVRLSNTGRGDLAWSITPPVPWLTATPASGVIPSGTGVDVTLNVNRSLMPTPQATATVQVLSNDDRGLRPEIGVSVSASAGFPAGLLPLAHRVLDADASANGQVLVTVSEFPNQLNIFDLARGTISAVPLVLAATTVSIRPDGAFAVVGHDGEVTLVDIANRTVVRRIAVPIDVLDVVAAPNGWAYAFPRRDQWTSIRSINLATGSVDNSTNHPGIYAGTLGRLHPSGAYLYGSQNGLSPADHEKFDISGGVAVRLYDSRYHGDYPMGGDSWITSDGSLLVNRYAHAFRLSASSTNDLLYSRRLTGANLLRWATDVPSHGRMVVVPMGTTTEESVLRVFDYPNLVARGTVVYPAFGSLVARGRFAFAAGDHVYVLVQGDNGTDDGPWALVVLEAGALP